MLTDLELLDVCQKTYDEPATIDTGSVHVRIETVGEFKVIAFRGTANTLDWLRNASVVPANTSLLGRVHSGFFDGMMSVWPRIPADGKIVITGHSKGGAEAKLLAAMFAAGGRPPAKLTTFGAPRVCWFNNSRTADLLKTIDGVDYRNADDPVPNVPIDYHHPREIVQIGKRFEDLHVVEDHFLAAYRASLAAL